MVVKYTKDKCPRCSGTGYYTLVREDSNGFDRRTIRCNHKIKEAKAK